jgi:hypothetical protein
MSTKKISLINLPHIMKLVDWSVGWRLQRNQHQPKAPQERSDEEIEVMPAGKRPPETEINEPYKKRELE